MLKTKPVAQHVQDSLEGVSPAENSQSQCGRKPLAMLLRHINRVVVAIRHSSVHKSNAPDTPRPMEMAALLAGRYLKEVSRHSSPSGELEIRPKPDNNEPVREVAVVDNAPEAPYSMEMPDLLVPQYLRDVLYHSSLPEESEIKSQTPVQAVDDSVFPDPRARLFAQLGIRDEEKNVEVEVEKAERIIASLSHIEVKERIEAAHILAVLYERLSLEKKMHARINLILMTWRDVNAYARIAAIKTLGRTEMPDVAEALQIALRDEERDVRAAAARALGSIKGENPSIALIAAATRENEHWSVRAAAIRAMGNRGNRVFLNTINLALDDKDDSVRIAAIHALAQLEGLKAVPRLVLIAQRDRQLYVRDAAILEVENLGTDV